MDGLLFMAIKIHIILSKHEYIFSHSLKSKALKHEILSIMLLIRILITYNFTSKI